MLKTQLNRLDVAIRCAFPGPFLIKDGRYDKPAGENPDWPNTIFISRNTEDEVKSVARSVSRSLRPGELNYYVPASSLRGWLRSHTEKIVRTRSQNGVLCCHPFDHDADNPNALGCTKRLEALGKNQRPAYKYACVVCRLFGAGGLGSRIAFSDGDFERNDQNQPAFSVRLVDGIGIDRFTGGTASGVKFRNQVLENGAFSFTISIRNFEIWQLGLLAFVLRDLENGALKLGFGKTKGFGLVQGVLSAATLTYWRRPAGDRLAGIADMVPELENEYGAIPFDKTAGPADENLPPALGEPQTGPFGFEHTYAIGLTTQDKPKLSDLPFWQVCARQWLSALEKNRFKSIQKIEADTQGKTDEQQPAETEVG